MEAVDIGEVKGFTNVTLAKDQPEYLPLPVATDGNIFISKWKLSKDELEEVMITREIYIKLLTFGRGFPPIKVETNLEEIL